MRQRFLALLLLIVAIPSATVGRPFDESGARSNTLEDLYGDTGESFQGSFGFWSFEASPWEHPPQVGYGVGIDDVVVEWREFTLVQDTTDCATGGECAVVDVESNNTFQGTTLVTVTVLEKSPDAENDCDLDGTPDGTDDCDDDGVRDVVVRAVSNAEFAGEILYCNATANPNEYKADLPISALYDSPGVLFVAQQGVDPPVVTVTYLDDDGTGSVCKNSVDVASQGRVQARTTVFLNTGSIQVLATILSDNGDDDGFPDTHETVDMRLKITNKSFTTDVTGLTARLTTNDPAIDCILQAFINVGDLPAGGETLTSDAFTFHVGDVDRTTLGLTDLDNLAASFQVLFSADQFNALAAPQRVTLDLDLDASGGGTPTSYFESFEGGFGTFQPINMDANLGSLEASDGYRCQYADPDWMQSNSYGQITDCFLTATPTSSTPRC